MLSIILGYIKLSLYRLLVACIQLYLYISNKLIMILPKYIYSKTYNHNTSDMNYFVYEYWYKYNNKYYKFKAIEDNLYNFKDACKIYHPYNMTLINHCCIMDDNNVYIRDITKEIRYFMYYRGLIEWKYILIHLGIDIDIEQEKEYKLIMHMNDLDMMEKSFNVREIYSKKFNF
jgi:hypothetical protein